MSNVEQQSYNYQPQESRPSQYPSQSQISHFHPHPPQQQNRNNGRQAQEEASIKKAAAETKYFWNLVAKGNQKRLQNSDDANNNGDMRRNINGNDRNQQNKAREEMTLFGNTLDDASQNVPKGTFQDAPVGIIPAIADGEVTDIDPIVVDRVGLGEENVPILESFDELKNADKFKIPAFIIDNIGLMKYVNPTPIQKHSIPLGIAGYDLMCCAQTVSRYLRKLSIHLKVYSVF